MSDSPETNEPKSQCACAGVGPAISEIFKKFGPPEAARQHFTLARVEILKGLRALIDQRIQDLSQAQTRGTKVTVE